MEKSLTLREQIEKAGRQYFDDYLNGLKSDLLTVDKTFAEGAEYGYNLAVEKFCEL